MMAGIRSGTGGATSKRATSRIRHAPALNAPQTGQVPRCSSTSEARVVDSSIAVLMAAWAASHFTGHLLFVRQRQHQRGAGAMHPALHGPDAHAQDHRGLLVAEAEDF